MYQHTHRRMVVVGHCKALPLAALSLTLPLLRCTPLLRLVAASARGAPTASATTTLADKASTQQAREPARQAAADAGSSYCPVHNRLFSPPPCSLTACLCSVNTRSMHGASTAASSGAGGVGPTRSGEEQALHGGKEDQPHHEQHEMPQQPARRHTRGHTGPHHMAPGPAGQHHGLSPAGPQEGAAEGQGQGQGQGVEAQERLVESLFKRGALHSERAAQVLRGLDRALFTDPDLTAPGEEHADHPVPIGWGATISAPHMHALALELLAGQLRPGARVLDVGSGSGYLCAAFGLMVWPGGVVVGVDKVPELVERSRVALAAAVPRLMQDATIQVAHANALDTAALRTLPVQEFDAIHVGAAADELPVPLLQRLARGGRMVVPVGPRWSVQSLVVVDRDAASGVLRSSPVMNVGYVPLTRPSEMEDGYTRP